MASNIKQLSIPNVDLTDNKTFTYLLIDAASGSTSIKVQNIATFGASKIICIGEVGREQTEIIFTSSTTPSGQYIFLNSNLAFDHPQDTKVYLIDWDSVELSRALTATGAKTTLTISGSIGGTIAIQVDHSKTVHNDNQYTSGYYFYRFRDGINAYFSDYSDPIPYSGYADNTVYSIKKRALESVDVEIDGKLITDEFLNGALWEARRELHNAPGKRPWRQRFDIDIGNVSGGMYKIATPSDLDEPDTAKNLFGVRIGTERNLDYKDKKIIDEYYNGVPHAELTQAYAVGDTVLFLDNSRDFNYPSGSVTCGTFSISYSANSIANGSLLISTAGESNALSGADVWQNVSLGLPNYFTVMRIGSAGTAYIVFERPISQDYQGKNIYADYYRTLVEYDSDADVLDEPDYDMFVNYLAWRIKKKKDKGLISQEDNDYIEWIKRKTNALGNEREGQTIRMEPDMPGWEAF